MPEPLRAEGSVPVTMRLGGGGSARRAALAALAALLATVALGLSGRLAPQEDQIALSLPATPTPAPTRSPSPAPAIEIELDIKFGQAGPRRVPEILSGTEQGVHTLLGAHRFLVFVHRPRPSQLAGVIRIRAAGKDGPLSVELLQIDPRGGEQLHSLGTWDLAIDELPVLGAAGKTVLRVRHHGRPTRGVGPTLAREGFELRVSLSGSPVVPIIVIRLSSAAGGA
jgi:hypothetical protein